MLGKHSWQRTMRSDETRGEVVRQTWGARVMVACVVVLGPIDRQLHADEILDAANIPSPGRGLTVLLSSYMGASRAPCFFGLAMMRAPVRMMS